ncbi:MAG: hypothetical protein ACYDHZ_00875 [Dehalococcoidia bacterium]
MTSAFPVEIKKCPVCGSPDTMVNVAVEEAKKANKLPHDFPFGSAEKVAAALIDQRFVGAMAPAVLMHFDVCYNCGTRYCTKAEIIQVPVQVQMNPRGKMQPPFGHG